MAIEVKICGISTPEAMAAAVAGGAHYVGMAFFPRSPRNVTPAQARALCTGLPDRTRRVGLFVDPDDETLASVLAEAPLDLLQLHGNEDPRRVAAIRARFERPVMKVLKIGGAEDFAAATPYLDLAERLLFDAKTPKNMKGALPGGNAVSFDWSLLSGRKWPLPWMLAGGLTAENLPAAVEASGARAVDTSSGVEDAPGRKSSAKIRDFLATAAGL